METLDIGTLVLAFILGGMCGGIVSAIFISCIIAGARADRIHNVPRY